MLRAPLPERPARISEEDEADEGRSTARIPPAARRRGGARSRPSRARSTCVVKIGGAGVCRTDLHIIEGQWAEAMAPDAAVHDRPRERRLGARGRLRGDQRRGRRHGDPAPDARPAGCAGPAGPATTCTARTARFPGLDSDGGMAEYLLTSARACVKLDPATQPKDVAALADAGITAYHAVRKAVPLLYPGTTCVVIGAGGLGHIGIQCLAALTATTIIVVDRNPDALKLAEQLGADHTVRRRRQPGRRGPGPDRRHGRRRRARLRRRAGRRAGRLRDDRAGRFVLRDRLRRHSCRSRRSTSSPPSATSSATSSAPTTSWPS